mmetsp:Transcript_68182/g.205968  ORF Transcript_68182/g.205968 Transcript_68182/m.205968 type:complete len:308 (+) Transcript_68182:85-1008(+)
MPLRAGLFHCRGSEGKCNWLLVRHAPAAGRCVVFFPGDISDFAGGSCPDHFSLEALLWVLCCKFPDDTVVLVKPRMMIDFFAIYVNFMLVDGTGNPRPLKDLHAKGDEGGDAAMATDDGHGAGEGMVVQPPNAAAHLQALLSSLESEIGEALPEPLVLVGFSKGAAVLCALLREGGEASLWGRCEGVHFVDAGLAVPGIFPVRDTELQAVRANAREGFTVWMHGTPRQMQDPARTFVAEEAEAFVQRCQAAGLRTEQRSYGDGRPPSLEMHFDAVRCFLTRADDEDGGGKHCGFFQSWAEASAAADA